MSTKKKITKQNYSKQAHNPVEIQRVPTKAERDVVAAKLFADGKKRQG